MKMTYGRRAHAPCIHAGDRVYLLIRQYQAGSIKKFHLPVEVSIESLTLSIQLQ